MAGLCFAAGPLRAQGLPQDETMLFQDLSRVVGASRYEQDTREAPASITIITAEDIRRNGYRTLGDVLANVRGFVVNDDRNYLYLGVRGFAVPGDFNSRLLFLVDGHRINDGVYEAGLLGTDELIDLSVVERIEVVRGPSSSLYGTSALFGVVNIVTRQGRAVNGAEGATSAGSWGTYQGSLTAGRRFGGGVEVLLSSSLYRSAGQDLYFPEFDAPATNDGWAVAADRDRYDRQFAKIGWGDLTLQAGRSWRLKHIPTGSYQTIFNDARAQTLDTRSFVVARYDHGFIDASRVEATLGYDAYTYRGRYPYTDGIFADYGVARWWSFDGQYVRSVGGGHRLVAGTEVRWYTRQDQGGENVDSGIVAFRSRRDAVVWALFAQDEWRLGHLSASAGVRHDHYETFGGTTNPRLSLVYQVGDLGAVKLLYGRAFRAPNAYELDYYDGFTTKAPTSLRPETIENYEAVFEGVPARGLRVTASVFHLRLSDLVTQVVDPADSLLVYENRGRVRSQGIELEADVRLTGGMSAGVSYTWQDAEDAVTGADLAGAPRHLATARLSVPALRDRWRATLAARYASAQRTALDAPVRASTVADLTVLGRLTEHVTLDGTISNLFDAAYANPAGSEQLVAVIPQNRRNARVGVAVRF